MKKVFVSILFLSLLFIGCQNNQQNVEEQSVESVTVTETESEPKTVQKETNYFPAIERYLVNEIGSKYLQGEYCVPFQTVIAVDERNGNDILVWGDFWVFNYNLVGDILETVSGGSHPGLMHIKQTDTGFEVTAFDQVEDGSNNLPSAKRIFGDKYNNFHAVNSDDKRREQHRAEVLAYYVKKNGIAATKYKDYGWPEKQLPFDKAK